MAVELKSLTDNPGFEHDGPGNGHLNGHLATAPNDDIDTENYDLSHHEISHEVTETELDPGCVAVFLSGDQGKKSMPDLKIDEGKMSNEHAECKTDEAMSTTSNENCAIGEKGGTSMNANTDATICVVINDEEQLDIPDEYIAKLIGPYDGMSSEILLQYSGTPFWRRMRRVVLFLMASAWLALLAAVIALVVIHPKCRTAPDRDWWQNAVVYRVNVGDFKDSNNDGVGDIQGLASLLDYIKSLGVSAVSLTPFYPHSYDDTVSITNHSTVDGRFGTMQDFVRFLNKAHDKGLRVIIDFIPNHTSDKHAWFVKALRDPLHKYYVWETNNFPPNNWESLEGGKAWQFEKSGKRMYLGQTGKNHPDLDLRNPLVRTELENILKLWLSVGVDGFYIRHSEYLFEDYLLRNESSSSLNSTGNYGKLNHKFTSGLPEINDMFARWRYITREYSTADASTKLLLADISGPASRSSQYYEKFGRDGVHVPLNHGYMDMSNDCGASCLANRYINAWFNATPANKTFNWMVGSDNMPSLLNHTGSKSRARAMLMLNLLLPGVAYTFYGNELDTMTELNDSLILDWSENSTMSDQQDDEFSTLSLFKNLTSLRTQAAFKHGSFRFVTSDNDVVSYVREFDGVYSFMVVINFGKKSVTRNLESNEGIATSGTVVLTTGRDVKYKASESVKDDKIELGPDQGIVVKWPYSIKQYI